MKEILLSGEIMDVVYYTNMIARNTFMANGDMEYLPYLVLLDSAVAPRAATPKELARVLDIPRSHLEGDANVLERSKLVLRTRSPLDRRVPAFVATAPGRKQAVSLNRLLETVAFNFWDIDEDGLSELVMAIEPFQRTRPREWFADSEVRVSLRSLCALFILWSEFRFFSRTHFLTYSEMHMLLITDQFGPQPAHALYRDRNQFALNDYASNKLLAHDEGLLKLEDGNFILSRKGEQKVRDLKGSCEPGSKPENADPSSPEAKLLSLCRRMTEHAMADGIDAYRGTAPGLPRIHGFSERPW